MAAEDLLKEYIFKLEEKLLQPNVRKSEQELSELLADNFIEFGSSGHIYDKQQMIAALRKESSGLISINEFNLRILAADVVLITYRAFKEEESGKGENANSLRSSIWKLFGDKWQIVFHQGTPQKAAL